MMQVGFLRADFALVGEASSRLLECARRAGIRREQVWAVRGLAAALTYGRRQWRRRSRGWKRRSPSFRRSGPARTTSRCCTR